MSRWNVIPTDQQKPGKLMGGFWVVIQAYSVANQWTIALLGPAGATVSGGYGGWNVITVPQHIGITEFASPDNLTMDLDLIYDGWLVHPIIPNLPASFTRPPKLPGGVKYENPRGGKPIGPVTKMKTHRPVAPSPPRPSHLKNSHSSVIGSRGHPHAQALQAPEDRKPPPMRRDTSSAPRGLFIESALARLESFAIRQPGDDTPHSVRLYGAVPHADKRWVVTGIDWGDCIRDQRTGRRMRQEVTVHLLEFYEPSALRTLPRGNATGGDKTNKPVQVP